MGMRIEKARHHNVIAGCYGLVRLKVRRDDPNGLDFPVRDGNIRATQGVAILIERKNVSVLNQYLAHIHLHMHQIAQRASAMNRGPPCRGITDACGAS